MSEAGSRSARRELDRVGAFSDGVFAVAITLLVLNIEVPAKSDSGISDEHFLEDTLPDLLNLLQGYFIAFAASRFSRRIRSSESELIDTTTPFFQRMYPL